jgi:hypothetical protein
MTFLILAALLAAPNTPSDTAKHGLSGAFCAMGSAGILNAYTKKIGPSTVAGFAMCSAAYFAKEAIVDPSLYGGRFDSRDYTEGQIGVAGGTLLFLPLWTF